jgi:2-polyprenyl-6-methoxyphenol hydroxylase-like FAD-dependent oxidoreductase
VISTKRVAIIGSGFGGLASAIAIHKLCDQKNIEKPAAIVVFERDAAIQDKEEFNFSISIRADSGAVQVLDKLGALPAVMQCSSPSKVCSVR